MIGEVAKTKFIATLARLTDTPLPYVRQRVRVLFDDGIGPRRNEPLTFGAISDYLIGFLSSPLHLEAPEITRKFRGFQLVETNHEHNARAALKLLRLGREPPLHAVLAAIIEARARESVLHVLDLTAAWPPHEQFSMGLLLGGGSPSVTLTFAAQVLVLNHLVPSTSWPLCHQVTMKGHVVDAIALLGTPDETSLKVED